MFRRATALICVTMLIMTLFAGCGTSSVVKNTASKDYAQTLYDAKNPYISNTNADTALINLLRLNGYGKFTMSVADKEKPYTLYIRYMYLNNNVDEAEFSSTMSYSSMLLLALIDDCELVTWNYPSVEGQKTGSIGVDYTNELLGLDIKKSAKDIESFSSLCYTLFPDRAPAQ